MTEGEFRVGIDFNPAKDSDVGRFKEKTAELIDLISVVGKDGRCSALAQTAYEEACMWAVKSITKKTENQT